jgi:hypothetical protein
VALLAPANSCRTAGAGCAEASAALVAPATPVSMAAASGFRGETAERGVVAACVGAGFSSSLGTTSSSLSLMASSSPSSPSS